MQTNINIIPFGCVVKGERLERERRVPPKPIITEVNHDRRNQKRERTRQGA